MDRKKAWKKTGFGILFVAACFAAAYILMAFHGRVLLVVLAAVLLLVTAFLFLNAVFSDKAARYIPEEKEPEAYKEPASTGNHGKHIKETESTQKELIEVLKNQNMLLKSQIEHMEQAITALSEKQANQIKSIIKFNKENARQLAISERETLEYVMMELKAAIENNAGKVVVAAPAAELEELAEEELFEVSDLPGDDEYEIPDIPTMEEPVAAFVEEPVAEEPVAAFVEEPVVEEPAEVFAEEPVLEDILAIEEPVPEPEEIQIPDMPEDIDLSALFEDMTESIVEEVATEEIAPVEEPVAEPAADPLAGLSGDPNAMMTPEDIAKLLASMGQ